MALQRQRKIDAPTLLSKLCMVKKPKTLLSILEKPSVVEGCKKPLDSLGQHQKLTPEYQKNFRSRENS